MLAFEEVEANADAAEGEECLVDVVTALVTDRQPAVLGQPRQGPLDDPPVAAEPLARVDAAAGDAAADPPPPEVAPTPWVVVALVGVQLARALSRPPRLAGRTTERGDRLD